MSRAAEQRPRLPDDRGGLISARVEAAAPRAAPQRHWHEGPQPRVCGRPAMCDPCTRDVERLVAGAFRARPRRTHGLQAFLPLLLLALAVQRGVELTGALHRRAP